MVRRAYSLLLLVGIALSGRPTSRHVDAPTPQLLHGPLVGDVRADRAIVWAHVTGAPEVACELRQCDAPTDVPPELHRVRVGSGGTFRLMLDGLLPGTDYELHLPGLYAAPRRFRTATAPDRAAPLRVGFGGDIGGQRMGRDLVHDLPAVAALADQHPDVFVGMGDMIYATRHIPAVSRVGNTQLALPMRIPSLGSYREHWRYLHDSPNFATLLRHCSYIGIWDDHEVNNNFGPGDSVGYLEIGRTAMLEWNPIDDADGSLYRTFRHGRHVQLWVLDCRSCRAPTHYADDGPVPKSMLGRRQRDWLLRGLAASDATWKVIVTSVPLTAPTGDVVKGRDGWSNAGSATGYERELVALLRSIAELGIEQPVFVTADVHHAEVIRLHPFADRPDFAPLELVTGPLNAGCFGRGPLDPTLNPESLFYLDPSTPHAMSYEQILTYWNFLLLDFAVDGRMQIRIHDGYGDLRYELQLSPSNR